MGLKTWQCCGISLGPLELTQQAQRLWRQARPRMIHGATSFQSRVQLVQTTKFQYTSCRWYVVLVQIGKAEGGSVRHSEWSGTACCRTTQYTRWHYQGLNEDIMADGMYLTRHRMAALPLCCVLHHCRQGADTRRDTSFRPLPYPCNYSCFLERGYIKEKQELNQRHTAPLLPKKYTRTFSALNAAET